MMTNFPKQEKYYNMNILFKNKDNKKWTWLNVDGKTKNTIDYVVSKYSNIIEDGDVLYRYNTKIPSAKQSKKQNK